jgi:hypothetical protein
MSEELHDADSRWQLNVTYRCNLTCKNCVQTLDEVEYDDCDIDVEAVIAGGKIVKERNIRSIVLRLSGGEPLLHKDLGAIIDAVADNWRPKKLIICTNSTIQDRPELTNPNLPRRSMYRLSPFPIKEEKHRPHLISPKDLGMEPSLGFSSPCFFIMRCGRLFDKYGFAGCGAAGTKGRLLRIDPYHDKPVWFTQKSICEHCIFTLQKWEQRRVWRLVASGKIPSVTKTYKDALERDGEEPFQFTPMKYA